MATQSGSTSVAPPRSTRKRRQRPSDVTASATATGAARRPAATEDRARPEPPAGPVASAPSVALAARSSSAPSSSKKRSPLTAAPLPAPPDDRAPTPAQERAQPARNPRPGCLLADPERDRYLRIRALFHHAKAQRVALLHAQKRANSTANATRNSASPARRSIAATSSSLIIGTRIPSCSTARRSTRARRQYRDTSAAARP